MPFLCDNHYYKPRRDNENMSFGLIVYADNDGFFSHSSTNVNATQDRRNDIRFLLVVLFHLDSFLNRAIFSLP